MTLQSKLLLLLLSIQFSCASITASSHDMLRINASPRATSVRVNGVDRGPAPMSVEVSKKGNTFVEVVSPGYRPSSCSTQMSAGGGYIVADIALCVLLFPIGCISFIDAGGAWNQLDAPQCDVTLAPEK